VLLKLLLSKREHGGLVTVGKHEDRATGARDCSMNISVIVCTYNRCELLANTLDCIAAQTVPDPIQWEVVVVDNNSSDQTRELVERFCVKDPTHFRLIFEEEQGLSNARNAGIRNARGEILAFTDDDIIIEPDWLWNLTSSLQSGQWAGAGGRIVPVPLGVLPNWLPLDDFRDMGPFAGFDLGPVSEPLTRPPYGGNMAYRREVFETYGVFRADLGRAGTNLQGREEIEFANRLMAGGEKLRYEPAAVVQHIVPECRMSKSYVLRWYYCNGRSEVADEGPPTNARWKLCGVPLHMFRKLARWGLQWMISVRVPRRFYCQRTLWYVAGITFACFQHSRRQVYPPNVISGKKTERTPS
jgi:glucosyl-dolichyl phosphate glucuronosyltransferase